MESKSARVMSAVHTPQAQFARCLGVLLINNSTIYYSTVTSLHMR